MRPRRRRIGASLFGGRSSRHIPAARFKTDANAAILRDAWLYKRQPIASRSSREYQARVRLAQRRQLPRGGSVDRVGADISPLICLEMFLTYS